MTDGYIPGRADVDDSPNLSVLVTGAAAALAISWYQAAFAPAPRLPLEHLARHLAQLPLRQRPALTSTCVARLNHLGTQR